MLPLVLLGGFVAYLVMFSAKNENESGCGCGVTMDLLGMIRDAISREIVVALQLPDKAVDILRDHAAFETGDFKAWYLAGPQRDGKAPTYNLWNRHKGSGRGDWDGEVKFISDADADVRIFRDVYQSARDFRQLLTDPLYKFALMALRHGDAVGYFSALEHAGFSATKGAYAGLSRRYEGVV